MNKDKILTEKNLLDDAFKPIKFLSKGETKEDQPIDLVHENAAYNQKGVYKQV